MNSLKKELKRMRKVLNQMKVDYDRRLTALGNAEDASESELKE